MYRRILGLVLAALGLARGQSAAPLRLKQTVPLPGVAGRLDHLAADVAGRRLFVAALGNNTVEVVDWAAGRRLHTITGLRKPQGILYLADPGRLYVAAGDGSCRIYDASSYRLIKTVTFGDDADNIRYDASAGRVYVGYGSGAIGAMDRDGNQLANIALDAHPESFQLETLGSRIFVNLPGSKKVGVVDRRTNRLAASWNTAGAFDNYPMAFDERSHRLFVVCRRPPRLLVLNTDTGNLAAEAPAVGDCDDVFFDALRKRIYASGGEGALGVLQQVDPDRYQELARIKVRPRARTSLFSPQAGLFFLAAPAQNASPAAIEIYEPQP